MNTMLEDLTIKGFINACGERGPQGPKGEPGEAGDGFYAVYGTTSFDEIKAAADKNIPVHCIYNKATYPLVNITEDTATFTASFDDDELDYSELRVVKCNAEGWSFENRRDEKQSNRRNDIDFAEMAGEDLTKLYPSLFAVKTYVEEHSGGGTGEKIEWENEEEGVYQKNTLSAEDFKMHHYINASGEEETSTISFSGIGIRYDAVSNYGESHRAIPTVRVEGWAEVEPIEGVDGLFGSIKIGIDEESGARQAYIYLEDIQVPISEHEYETVPHWVPITWPSVEGVQF